MSPQRAATISSQSRSGEQLLRPWPPSAETEAAHVAPSFLPLPPAPPGSSSLTPNSASQRASRHSSRMVSHLSEASALEEMTLADSTTTSRRRLGSVVRFDHTPLRRHVYARRRRPLDPVLLFDRAQVRERHRRGRSVPAREPARCAPLCACLLSLLPETLNSGAAVPHRNRTSDRCSPASDHLGASGSTFGGRVRGARPHPCAPITARRPGRPDRQRDDHQRPDAVPRTQIHRHQCESERERELAHLVDFFWLNPRPGPISVRARLRPPRHVDRRTRDRFLCLVVSTS